MTGGLIETTLRIPLRVQIHDDLAAMIREKGLAPGSRLPTMWEVARQYGVSLRTAAAAFEMLRDEGLVVSRTAKGTFVAPSPEKAATTELILCIHPTFLGRKQNRWRAFERLNGIMLAAEQRGARLFSITREEELETYLHPQAQQGLILFDGNYQVDGFGRVAHYAVEHDMPVCTVMGPPAGPVAVVDNRDKGFEQVVAHLLALGHRRIALLNAGTPSTGAAERVRTGYLRAMKRTGDGEDPDLYVEADLPETHGREPTVLAVELLLSRSPRPTAIVCNNDDRGLVVLEALKAHGLRVPQDVSVTGCDDSPECRKIDPPLTSIDTLLRQQGEEAVHYLVNRLQGRRVRTPSVAPRLVVRASTGVPGSSSVSIARGVS